MNRLSVKINGMEYTLKGEEKEEYLLKLASYVDKKLKSIMDINPRLDTTSASVLTAVNTIDEMFKQIQAYEEIAIEKEELKKNEIVFNKELKDFKKRSEDMEQINEELKVELKNYKEQDELKDEMIKKLKDSLQKHLKEVEDLKDVNKEMKFQNQSAKYKILDLQQKLMDSQISVAKTKKRNFDMSSNPLNKNKPL